MAAAVSEPNLYRLLTFQVLNPVSLFHCIVHTEWSIHVWGLFVHSTLAPRPTPKLEDHPLLAIRDCLFNIFTAIFLIGWYRGIIVVKVAVLQIGKSLVLFQMVSLEFFIDIILLIALWPWGQFSLLQKWVPGVFPEGKKRPVHKANNLTTILGHCHIIWELYLPGTF